MFAFTTHGRRPIKSDIQDKLLTLASSRLKPQKKYFFLVKFLLPSYLHQLTFAKLHAGTLNKLDILTRYFTRKILHISHDVPVAAYHSLTMDGGLGLPSLRWMIPQLAHARGMECDQLRTYDNKKLNSNNQVLAMFRRRLFETCDGKGLREMRKVPQQSRWVLDGTSTMSGSGISTIAVRLNSLYSRSRASRGRSEPHDCSRGCEAPETLNHILQNCY